MSRSSGSPKAGINVTIDFPHLGLHAAAATGNIGLAKYAISHGQPINSVINGVLPLHAACSGGHALVVKLLIDNGADVNAPRLPRHISEKHDPSAPIIGTLGSTPLHFAAANGHTQIVLTLLRHGARPDIADKRGTTPDALSRQHGWNTCANIMHDWIANKDRDLLKYDTLLGAISPDHPKPISQIPEHHSPLCACEGPECVSTQFMPHVCAESSIERAKLLRRVTSLQDDAVPDYAWTPPESLNDDSLLAPCFRKPAGFIAHSGFSLFDAQSTSNQSIVMSNFTHSSTYSSIEAIGNESSSYSAYHKLRTSQPVSVSSAQTKLSNVTRTEWNAIGVSMMGPGLLEPSGVVLDSKSSRGGRQSNTNVPRQSSQLDDNDSFSTTPMLLPVASELVLSSSPLNAPSSPLSISAERTSSHEKSTGSGSVLVSGPSLGSGSDSINGSLPPQPSLWDLQSEVNQANGRRQIRPKSYRVFDSEPRQPWMDDRPITSGEYMSPDSQQVLVVMEGKGRTEYQLGNCIGGGRFKSVFRAFNLNTGQMVAVKRVDLRGWRKGEVEQLMREIDLVKQLSHPSIIKYEGMTRDKDMLNIVLEYAENGTLEQTLKAFGKLNEKLVASYVTKLLDGLNYIHCSGVVHGDLRAANILTTKDGSVKLSNFGRSEIEIVMGSPNWVAPEVLELKGMSTKSDIWSLGCAVMELLTGQPPYADMADDVQVLRIVEGTPPLIPESFCDPLVVFLKECFHKEPAERPKAKELLIHAWLKNHCGVKKGSGLRGSLLSPLRLGTDLQNRDPVGHLKANLDLSDGPVLGSAMLGGDDITAVSKSRDDHPLTRASVSSNTTELPQAKPNPFVMCEHSIVKMTFKKAVSCRLCMEPMKRSAVLCSLCSLIAHSKCIAAPSRTSILTSNDQFAERSNLVNILTPSPGTGSSNGSAGRDCNIQPYPSAPSSRSLHGVYKVLSVFKLHRRRR